MDSLCGAPAMGQPSLARTLRRHTSSRCSASPLAGPARRGQRGATVAAAAGRGTVSEVDSSSPGAQLATLFSGLLSSLPGLASPAARSAAKQEVLQSIQGLNRGVTATKDDVAAVEAAVRKLERLNPTPGALASPLVNGKWELVYTTSVSILGSNRPPFLRPLGPIYQFVDAPRKRAKNQETWPFFSSVTAELTPTGPAAVNVQFKTFRLLGFIPVTAPAAAKGSLSFSYVDEEMRISRGDKGNLFILLMADPSAELQDSAFESAFALSDAFAAKSVREFR